MLRHATDARVAGAVHSKWRHKAKNFSDVDLEGVQKKLREDINRLRGAGNEVSVNTYHEVMKVVGKGAHGGQRVMHWYDQMTSHGVRPDNTTSMIILRAHGQAKDIVMLKKAWSTLCETTPQPPLPVYNTYIMGLIACRHCHEACRMVKDMEANGPLPSVVTYTLMLQVDKVQREKWTEKIREMNKGMLDTEAEMALFRLACTEDGYTEGHASLQNMRDRGVKYDVRAFLYLLGCCRSGEQLASVWNECKRDGFSHTVACYNTVLAFLSARACHVDDSFHKTVLFIYFTALHGAGHTPSYSTVRHVLQSCAKTGDVLVSEKVRRSLPKFVKEKSIINLVLDSYREDSLRESHPERAPIFAERVAALDDCKW
eukprot:TRINITY_DN7162_c0_g1_i1.p1 TRINITY_DN7162_c0_g1~~TRINITY_DN7162_c0_g1_i1.p1  ORF type:complete len:371 (+),score=85.43 TRINITY_DN7162_c0_g1_i1:528-1640(+)